MAHARPNEADTICNRFEMGMPRVGDMILLCMLKIKGIEPIYYDIDKVTLAPKRRSPDDLPGLRLVDTGPRL